MNTYTQPHHVADEVSRWTSLGVELPNELDKAIEVYEVLRYTEVGYRPVFDLSKVTTANAEKRIREYADELALSASGGGLSVLEKAKNEAVDAAARRVNVLARQAVPSIIEQLTPEFENHVEAYADAVLQLPNDITSEALLAAGPDAVGVYGEAQQEVGYLNRISSWSASTNSLPGGTVQHENVILILRPTDGLELIKLDEAAHVPASPALAALNPIWVAAVRRDVEFGINTPRQAADIRRRLELETKQQSRLQNVAFLPTA